MRTYVVHIDNGRQFTNWPGDVVYSQSGIRAVAVAMFIREFGKHPEGSWRWKKHTAGAYMKFRRGVCQPSIEVDQIHGDVFAASPAWIMHEGLPHPYSPPSRQLAFSQDEPKTVYDGALGRTVREM